MNKVILLCLVSLSLGSSLQAMDDLKERLGKELIRATEAGNPRQVQASLERGADINYQDSLNENTALLWAIDLGYSQIAKFLIEKGARLDIENEWGNTALIKAATFGRDDILRLLIDRGAQLDHANKAKKTAFANAAQHWHLDACKILIDAMLKQKSKDAVIQEIQKIPHNDLKQQLMQYVQSKG